MKVGSTSANCSATRSAHPRKPPREPSAGSSSPSVKLSPIATNDSGTGTPGGCFRGAVSVAEPVAGCVTAAV